MIRVSRLTETDRNGPKRTFVDTETDFLGTETDLNGYRNRLSGYRNGLLAVFHSQHGECFCTEYSHWETDFKLVIDLLLYPFQMY